MVNNLMVRGARIDTKNVWRTYLMFVAIENVINK